MGISRIAASMLQQKKPVPVAVAQTYDVIGSLTDCSVTTVVIVDGAPDDTGSAPPAKMVWYGPKAGVRRVMLGLETKR